KPLTNDDLEAKRSEARHSQMTIDTLRIVAERLQLDTSGSKTDLIERISTCCPKQRSQQEEGPALQNRTQMTKTEVRAKIEEEWTEEHFERSRDQHEYNLLRAIGRDLDISMNSASVEEAVSYIDAVKKKVKDQMILLKVAKKYRWDVAVELPQSTDEELTDYIEVIDRARQVAAGLLGNKNKSITINIELAKKWHTFISQRVTPFNSTANSKTIQNEYGTIRLDKKGTKYDVREWSNKMGRTWVYKTSNTYGSQSNFFETKNRPQKMAVNHRS
ncbi:13297_t:CDS:2, partial [Racocetra fulgida]